MRKGFNPHKDKPQEKSEFVHQVILPVYIPNQEEYFKDSFRIFQLCLESLCKTIHNKTFISVINNGSCIEVETYINDLFACQRIHEIIHTTNIGKLNSIIKGLVGNEIELVTISDSDVLFLPNWQQETVKIFNGFPKAGVVGIVPQFRNFSHLCGNVILENFFSKKMKFVPVKNQDALLNFFQSIGWEENQHYNKAHLKWNLTIENQNILAVIGSGHFVTTYKRELFNDVKTYFGYKLGAETERYLDEMPLKYDLWRLTTYDNFAYHMGNTYDDWMSKTVDEIDCNASKHYVLLKVFKTKKISKASFFIKNKLFIKLFNFNPFRRFFYKIKGLPKEVISKY